MLRRALAVSVLALALVVPQLLPAQGATLPLGQRVLVGAWAPPSPWQGMDEVVALESALERRLDIVHFFETWETTWDRFYRQALVDASAGGRTVLLTLEPWAPGGPTTQPKYTLASISSGEHDVNLRAWARGLRDFKAPVHLRPMHEMNGDWYPWSGVRNGNTPAQFVAAWRHMHQLFAAEGASNVRWVWSPNAMDVPVGNRMESYYPGPAYVDVVGLDGYNWGAEMPAHGGWQSFDRIFADGYKRVTALGPHPVWLAEVAADEAGGDKAAWIRDMLGSTAYPQIEAIVWFNERKERDWRINSSAASLAAFRDGLRGGVTSPAPTDGPSDSDGAADTPALDDPSLGGGSLTPSLDGSGVTVSRLSGADRYETARAVAEAAPTGSGVAVLASGEAFPDALAAASLAGVRNAPVLLTGRTRLHVAVVDMIERQDVTEVFLAGGSAAVDTTVEAELVGLLGRDRVHRIAGRSRYETAAALALAATDGRSPSLALLASGDSFPDALAAGALAAGEQLPLLLAAASGLPEVTRQALADLAVDTVAIVGGPASVPTEVEAELTAAGYRTIRLAGPTRTATAGAIAAFAQERFGWSAASAVLARGDAFPDALSAGPHAGRQRAPLLLTPTRNDVGIEAREWLHAACGVRAVALLGGLAALSEAVEASVRDVLAVQVCAD